VNTVYHLELGDLDESKFDSIWQIFDSIHHCCISQFIHCGQHCQM